MTHDFAKKPKATNKNKNQKKKEIKKSAIPGWVWLFTGLVAGVFLSFLGYLSDIKPDTSASTTAAKSNTDSSTIKPDSKTSTTHFDFYTLLPEREMIVPTQREEPSTTKEQSVSYILQAGSFRNNKDADRLRAKLILMGMNASVEEVTVKNGGLWHRVQVGPFHSRSKLSKTRNTLISEGIDTLLLKRKSEH
ncbi:MAG: SPOR domain-containing protein [Spongiibacteraceae bacterium]|nr:SPOR domain-containing protein [Spongiibacteraceae bacterium]